MPAAGPPGVHRPGRRRRPGRPRRGKRAEQRPRFAPRSCFRRSLRLRLGLRRRAVGGGGRRGVTRCVGEDRCRARGAEGGQQVRDRRPGFGRFGQAAANQPGQLMIGQPGQIRRLVDNAEHHRDGRVPAERRPARRRERQQAAQREHVAGRTSHLATDLLGGHVRERAHDHARRGERHLTDRPGDPEVDDPGPVRRQDHVAGLEVPVHQAAGVDRAQPLGQPGAQRLHPAGRQRPVPADSERCEDPEPSPDPAAAPGAPPWPASGPEGWAVCGWAAAGSPYWLLDRS